MKLRELLFRKRDIPFHPHDHFQIHPDVEWRKTSPKDKKLGLIHSPRVNTTMPPMVLFGNNQQRRPNQAEIFDALKSLRSEVNHKLYGDLPN